MGFFNNKPKTEPQSEPIKPEVVKAVPEVNSAKQNPIAAQPSAPIITPQSTTQNHQKMNDTITTISAGTILEGTMKLEGDLLIEGTIKGTVTSKSKVTLGPNGKVDGDINCQEAEISGKVSGKLNVNDMLFLKGNALIDGDINTGKLVMESGVKFNGKCNMGAKNAGTPPSATPANSTVAQSNGTLAKANA